MYETTIQANTSHMHILQKLAEQLQPFIQSHHGLLATLHIPTGKQLTFAVPKKYSALLQKQIRHYVACFICEEEKYQYFVKNIMFSSQSEWWKEAFFLTLTQMDEQTDIQMLEHAIHFQHWFSISSFVYFHMHTLTQRWKEISSLITQNLQALMLTNSTTELVKYVLQSEPKQCMSLHIVFTPTHIEISQNLSKPLASWSLAQSHSAQRQALTFVIKHLPQKLYIHTQTNNAFATFLGELFEHNAYTIHTNTNTQTFQTVPSSSNINS